MLPFYDFQYGFRSSCSTADIVTKVSDGIPRAFNRSGPVIVVALEISKTFDSVWHACLLSVLVFGLISSFPSNRRLREFLAEDSSQEYPVTAGVPQGHILGQV